MDNTVLIKGLKRHLPEVTLQIYYTTGKWRWKHSKFMLV